MQTYVRCFFLAALATLAGCAIVIPTDPSSFNVEPNKLSQLRRPQVVNVANGYPGDAAKKPMPVGSHTWVFDERQLTDTAIAMFGRAMDKNAITTSAQADKRITMRVSVQGAHMRMLPFVSIITGKVALDAKFADGSSTYIEADNTSTAGAARAYDGAVLKALEQLLEDKKFIAYMNL